ncbi:MAG: MGMT family protein [Omnitrophica WOR_2 bacterium]
MGNVYLRPKDQEGYNALVWEIVSQIPSGKVSTYGQIAGLIPTPEGIDDKGYRAFGPRWVGGAMAACPEGVPWQRVINSQGKISLRKGSDRQRQLLEEEGVEFDERDRVDLKSYGWEGPDPAWRKAHGLIQEPGSDDAEQLQMGI